MPKKIKSNRVYLVDGTNAVRRGSYDPRFPEMEEARTAAFLERLCLLSAGAEKIRIEVFFDGPRRPAGPARGPVAVRFTMDGDADEAILGAARRILNEGRGVVVVTEDRALRAEITAEGGRVMGLSEFDRRLRDGRS